MPLFRFSRPLLVLFDGERLAFVVLSTPPKTAEGVCRKSPPVLRQTPLLSRKSPRVFSASCGLWEHNGRRLKKSSPRGRKCATNKAVHSTFSPTAVDVFLLIAPRSVAKEGRCFCPTPTTGGKMAVGAKQMGKGGRKYRRGGAEARVERSGHKGTKKRRQT